MLPDNRVSAVLCSTDLERSQEFYERKVGRPSPNKADHTQVRFWSADVAADVRELAGRGIEFDTVEFGDLKMVDHVLTSPGIGRSAWFKDPDGNTLALFQPE